MAEPLFSCKMAEEFKKNDVQSERNESRESSPLKPTDIVISGLSGRFPQSSNVEEFAENLFGGVDMITDDGRRWTPGVLGLPTRSGKLKELDKFDADYFSVHAKQADFMDPQLRMLLEVTHEAIMDAGVNPQEIRGQNIGVFIGACASESEIEWKNDTTTTHGYALTGCQRTMLSNRISFEFDFKGPSFTLDTACSSSLMALEQAHAALRLGHCDAAIVGGSHLCLDPKTSLQFHKLNMLSPQGKCQSFDASGDGYVRSEAVVAIFLQRKNVARRYYASILAVKTNTDGHKAQGVTFPSGDMQKILLQETYKEAGIAPRDVVYIEAHGTGTPAGDPQELNAIADVFCKDRNPENTLLIGSVKSNMGHSEPASGLCGVAKVLLAMQRGIIPGNLHYKVPNAKISALKTGQVKVVSESTKWNGGIVGVNSFGFGGANVHAILQSNPEVFRQTEKSGSAEVQFPCVIPFSGRSKLSVESAIKEISSKTFDRGQLHLLHEIHSKNISAHEFRGFAVVTENRFETEISVGEIKRRSGPPKVWFIFNGMGSQWAGMGKSLMKFQTCKESLEKSAAVLKAKNPDLDLLDILIGHPESSFENVLHSFVSITAIQIALVDLLSDLNIKPDGVIGHSVGELGAAYSDRCLSAEQVILMAYARGQAILEMGPGDGAMAAIGLSWEQALKKCPQGIYPACHNSKDSVTVSGPAKLINDFVVQLQTEGIFARKVNSSNQAFHSKYIEPAKHKFKESLDEIIPMPTPRSKRWISSSVPESQWDSDLAKSSSADYHVGNLISPVLFQEALEKVPSSSVVIEIGPHCLLQAILKRSLPDCSHIGLFNKTHKDNTFFLCISIGKMFNFGLNPSLANLYPQVHFPVQGKTRSLSSIVSRCWDHSKSWNVPSFSTANSTTKNDGAKNGSGGSNFEISLDNEQDAFYSGHKIDGRIIFPQTGLIVLAWRAWAQIYHGDADFEKISFTIENLVVSRATLIPKKGEAPLKFNIFITNGTGEFRIEESGVQVASGTIRSPLADDFISVGLISIPGENSQEIVLNQQDFYKYMRLRGYEYSGVFQGVKRTSLDLDWAEVEFSNWVAFLDALVHYLTGFYLQGNKSLLLPTRLKRLVVDPQKFWEHLNSTKTGSKHKNSENFVVSAVHNPNIQLLSCEGVQIHGQKLEAAPRSQQQTAPPTLEKFEFVPYFDDPDLNTASKSTEAKCLQASIGVVLENLLGEELNVLEFAKSPQKMISPLIKEFCKSQPKKTCDAVVAVCDILNPQDKLAETEGIVLKYVDPCSDISNILNLLKEMSPSPNFLILHDLKIFKKIIQDIEVGTFVLLRVANLPAANREEIQSSLEYFDMCISSFNVSEKSEYYLCKKLYKKQLLERNHISTTIATVKASKNVSAELELDYNYKWVENLKAEMKKVTQDKINQRFRINIISRAFVSGQFTPSGILGLVNSLRRESGGQALRGFFINDPDAPVLDFQHPDQELQTVIKRDLLMNVYQNGKWGSYRFFPLQPQNSKQVEQAYLNFQKSGDLSSFQWFESPLKYSNQELCSVYYSALNFRDVMLASGKLHPGSLPNNLGNQDCIFGMEFSGLDSTGKRVMGILPAQAMATCVVPDPGFLWEVPSSWSLADGATVPVAYATAYYALVVRGGLEDGESVLIHGGAGAVGLAAISIALSKTCTVFTTVGSTEKREFLKTTFPQLNGSCFANSRDTSFLQHVMNETNGKGVDLVLNSLGGDKLLASIECVAQHGRFLELGKVDLFNDTKLGMSILLKNVSVSGILLDSLTNEVTVKHKIWELIEGGIKSRVVQPLNYNVFSDSAEEVEKAFRFMASGKHIGKILIQIRNDQEKPHEKIIKAQPRTYFDPSKSYIILGGLGGFGLELCGWMIERGATKLMLISRSGVTTGYQKLCLNRWNKLSEVSVVPFTKDTTTFEGATDILKGAIDYFNGTPIGGIFNLAMVLRDGLLENQTPENFEAVAKPKINASMAMDKASRILAPALEYFVCFSSIVSGRGSPGLSNYAYANSALERICEMRKSEGLAGLAIQWGAIGDVGVMVDKFKLKDDESVDGTAIQKISSCLNTLDIFLHSSLLSIADKRYSTLSSFVPTSKSSGLDQNTSQDNWIESIARILGLSVAELEKNPDKSFSAFGMDSLMSAEMKQLIEVTCGLLTALNSADLPNLSLSKFRKIMPSTSATKNKIGSKIPSTVKEPEIIEAQEIETLSSTDGSKLKSKDSSPVIVEPENLEPSSKFTEAQTKKVKIHPLVSSPRFGKLRKFLAYLLSILLLTLVYFVMLPMSSLVQVLTNLYIWLFQHTHKMKLVDGLGESIFIAENANSIHILKLSGVPKKEEIVSLLETRLFKPQSNIKVDSDSSFDAATTTTEEFWSNLPCDMLKRTIEKVFWLVYWQKPADFDVARHVVFEQVGTSDLDSEMPRLAKYYHNLKWDEHENSSSSSPSASRPWWEMRIVSSEKSQEFLLIFVWNHAYGDGRSAVRFIQQFFMDVPPPVLISTSKQVENDESIFSSADPIISKTTLDFSMLKELNHILTKIKQTRQKAHLLTGSVADILLQTWDTRKDVFVLEAEPHAASAFGKFPLSLLKSVKDPETGKSFNLNAVVLTICARVYRRIAQESKGSGVKCPNPTPTQLLPYVTWSPFENSHLDLVNDTVILPTQVPLTFDSLGNDINDISSFLQTLSITQRNLAATGEMEKLLVVRQFLQTISAFPISWIRLIVSTIFKSTFVYSNVLAIMPKTTTFLNGYELKDMYGLAPPSPTSLIAITNSVNDSLSITLTVSQTILNRISPQFHQLFFPYFEEEMKLLQNCGDK